MTESLVPVMPLSSANSASRAWARTAAICSRAGGCSTASKPLGTSTLGPHLTHEHPLPQQASGNSDEHAKNAQEKGRRMIMLIEPADDAHGVERQLDDDDSDGNQTRLAAPVAVDEHSHSLAVRMDDERYAAQDRRQYAESHVRFERRARNQATHEQAEYGVAPRRAGCSPGHLGLGVMLGVEGRARVNRFHVVPFTFHIGK